MSFELCEYYRLFSVTCWKDQDPAMFTLGEMMIPKKSTKTRNSQFLAFFNINAESAYDWRKAIVWRDLREGLILILGP